MIDSAGNPVLRRGFLGRLALLAPPLVGGHASTVLGHAQAQAASVLDAWRDAGVPNGEVNPSVTLRDGVLPGVLVVPAMVVAFTQMQERGIAYVYAG